MLLNLNEILNKIDIFFKNLQLIVQGEMFKVACHLTMWWNMYVYIILKFSASDSDQLDRLKLIFTTSINLTQFHRFQVFPYFRKH